MKIEIVESKSKQQRKYPYVGVLEKGTIVLFIGPNKGVWLKSRVDSLVGVLEDSFSEENFVPFEGVIEISN